MKIINTYHTYPDLDEAGVAFLTVLTEGDIGDYAVYSGIVGFTWDYAGDYEFERNIAAQRVAKSGQKEPYERAVTFFPYLKRESYRQ